MPGTKFIVIYDTYCGWCYGAHPIFDALIKSGADVETYHCHLFQGANAHKMADGFGAQAESYDMRIAQMSGQPFSKLYVRNILRSDTEVLASALTAQAACLVHERGAKTEMSLAARLQKARYVDGVSAANRDAVVSALIAEGVEAEQANRIGTADLAAQTAAIADEATAWMRKVGASGVPTLIKIQDNKMASIDVASYFGRASDISALAK